MRSRLLFAAVLTVVAVPLVWRVFWIRPLYLDASIRPRIEHAVRATADREGWILSDIELKAVEASFDDIVIIHRPHLRGPDARTCYRINLETTDLRPCES